MTCQDVARITGQHLLFLGTSTQGWTLSQFSEAARFAKAHGVDSLLLKAADGAYLWYGGMAGYRNRRDIIKAEGIRCIPYIYSYGNKYGALETEISIFEGFLAEPDNIVVADLEVEWNGQVTWATRLCQALKGYGTFLVSTWADPAEQNWQGVLQALNPCVSAYMPQQYDDFLASCWTQFGAGACLQPTLSIVGVGPNNVIGNAKAAYQRGHTAISVWYYETAVANPTALDAIYAAFPGTQQGEQSMSIDLTTPGVNTFFQGSDTDDIWTCVYNGASKGFLIGHGILDFYKKFGGDALCGITYLGLPKGNEQAVTGYSGIVEQEFERAWVRYDPNHELDNPPESGAVYLTHTKTVSPDQVLVATLKSLIPQLTGVTTGIQAL